MRRLAVVAALLGGCGAREDGPRCVEAFEALAKRLGDPGSPTIAPMVGSCEVMKWSRAVRDCVANAATASAAATCIEPALVAADAVHAAGALKDLPAPTPGEDLKKAIAKHTVHVTWYAPDGGDPVTQRVQAYFTALGVTIEIADRFAKPDESSRYKVLGDGTLVIRRGGAEDRWERIELGLDPRRAKRGLARLDRAVSLAVTKLHRETRRLYVTTGHGEGLASERRFTHFDRELQILNLERRDLGIDVLAKDVPADATVVAILGPTTTFSEAEQAALVRYLERGGALLVALDPAGIGSLGAVDAKLGARLARGHLTDDKSFLPQQKTASDHRYVVTNKYTAHPATTAVSRKAQGTVFVEAGALERVAVSAKTLAIVQSMDSSFLDLDGDHAFDDGKEQRAMYDLAIATEAATYRAVLVADVDVFADALVPLAGGNRGVMMIGGALVNDILRWLGGEEKLVVDVHDDDPTAEPSGLGNPGRRALGQLEEYVQAPPARRRFALERLAR